MVILFGLAKAPPNFQAFVNDILCDLCLPTNNSFSEKLVFLLEWLHASPFSGYTGVWHSQQLIQEQFWRHGDTETLVLAFSSRIQSREHNDPHMLPDLTTGGSNYHAGVWKPSGTHINGTCLRRECNPGTTGSPDNKLDRLYKYPSLVVGLFVHFIV